MCDEWKNYFYNFYEWCISNGWNEQIRIDRVNKSGNFEPSNIKFSIKNKSSKRSYQLFNWMKQRCYNKNNISYKDYGGRGITICDEWLKNPQLFYDWTIDRYKEGLEIDRKDNDKGYSPDNCHFITRKENGWNKRLIIKSNTSGYKNVHFRKSRSAWESYIEIDGKVIYFGTSSTPEIAAIKRDKFIIENNLSHPLNFPELKILYFENIEEYNTAGYEEVEYVSPVGNFKHGLINHPLYKKWQGMKKRVRDKNLIKRGITICDEWHDFMPFYNWSIENGFSEELALIRKNSTKGYSPDNCHYIEMVYK